MIELGADTGEVADAVIVSIGERAQVDLVPDRVVPPVLHPPL
jgi:hypothetical protein